MKRITMTKNGENVILLNGENTILLEECKDDWSFPVYWAKGTIVDHLAAYEDIGLTPEGIEGLLAHVARLYKLIDNMEAILQEGETNSNS